ncbi:MAG: phosphoenolpyruvate--protein phosphotransferase [Ruminococcaceae bacterium]|nr:phosphoenolpyruvate--protein phosphotransferase [Oscillospiraceae bacterium]
MGIKMTESTVFKGIGISNGKVRGRIKFYNKEVRAQPSSVKGNKKQELERLDRARKMASEHIKALEKRALSTLGEKEAQIFEIHAMLLEDEDFISSIIGEINGGKSAEEAINITAKSYGEMLAALGDEYLAARQTDIHDISAQLIRFLGGDVSVNKEKDTKPYILVATDLTPSETVQLEASKILGFVTFGGTPSSHTAILARAMGIPALVGTGKIDSIYDGEEALLNAEKGTLTVTPDEKEIQAFEKERQEYNKIAKEHELYLRSVMNKPAVTRSGHKIMIYANIGSESEVASAISNGAEGIGLLRSEFLYLSKDDYPSQEELFSVYRDIAIKMQGKRVIVRTLDIGADKQIPYFDIPKEENPSLGYRAIRICLDRQELFKTQLKAILRASKFGRISIMLPMVVSADEVKQSKALLEECKAELLTRGEGFDSKIELGVMIETPAAAIMSEVIAKEVDFFSVGTNDLTQYTLAADRQNPRVTHICDNNAEPVMRLIKMATDAIHRKGGWIGVCGEMAADLGLTQQFATIGVDELSVSVPYLLGVRGKVSECR